MSDNGATRDVLPGTLTIRGRLMSAVFEVGTDLHPHPDKPPTSLVLRSFHLMFGWPDVLKDDLGGATVLVVQLFEDLIAAAPSDIDAVVEMGNLARYPQASMPAMLMMRELTSALVDMHYPSFAIEPAWARMIGGVVQALTTTTPTAEVLARARLSQIHRVIERFSIDPTLTPESLATAMDISRRTLYDLTKPSLGGVSEHLRLRRTELAHRLLVDPAWASVSATEIARRTGFSSAKHLRRALSSVTEFTPEQIRARRPTEGHAARPDSLE